METMNPAVYVEAAEIDFDPGEIPEGVDVHAVATDDVDLTGVPEGIDVHAVATQGPVQPEESPLPPGPIEEAPVQPQPETCPENYNYITIPYGWDVSNVLIRFGVSYQALAAANPGINLDQLYSGVALCVPPPGMPSLCANDQGTAYTMRGFDTLDSVARRFRVTSTALLSANPSLAPQDFVAGREICIPG